MKSVKTIIVTTIAASVLFFFLTPSTHIMEKEMQVRSGSTVNQLVVDAAQQEGIDTNSVDLNESRDVTIHEGNLDAGNLRPGTQVKVVVVYRK